MTKDYTYIKKWEDAIGETVVGIYEPPWEPKLFVTLSNHKRMILVSATPTRDGIHLLPPDDRGVAARDLVRVGWVTQDEVDLAQREASKARIKRIEASDREEYERLKAIYGK